MKLPISWLKEYVDINIPIKDLADKFSLSGSEVEHIENPRKFDKKIVVGEILEIKKHPNADRLNLTRVRVAKDKVLDIVCGASNIEVGQKVPVALEGVRFGDFLIKETEIRGAISKGMICSEQELGLEEASEGIMILDKDIEVGIEFNMTLPNEIVFDLDITPNRQDTLSIIGLAREASVFLNKKLKLPKIDVKETKDDITSCLKVEVKEATLCPRYMARVIKIKDNGESPGWLKERLLASGVRPINKIVDATNYVMLEWGEPLHAFDMTKIATNKSTDKHEIIVRKAKDGEGIETLDGVKRKLSSKDLVIADGKGPIAIAGVMGGKDSGVSEKTKTIILEAGIFDYLAVRKTSRKLGLRSESSMRFEKSLPLRLPEIALDRAASLIAEVCEGEVLKGKIDYLDKWIWVQHIGLKQEWLNNFIGQELPKKEILRILNGLGFEAEEFDIVKEARKHLNKPYKWGASFKTDGADAFDCGYLVDYIYSLIGQMVGHSASQIMESGRKINISELKPGDVLFRDGVWKKLKREDRNGVSHVAMYIGDGKIIQAEDHHRVGKDWVFLPEKEQKVRIDPLEVVTKDPQFIGAKRLVENLNGLITVTIPWWRTDITMGQDLAEEVVRMYGYANLKETLPRGELPESKRNERFYFSRELKYILSSIGLTETYNYSFLSEEYLKFLGEDLSKALKLENPSNPDQKYIRTSLMPYLLLSVQKNQNEFDNIKIFELANIYEKGKNKLPEESRHIGGAVVGGLSQGIEYKNGNEFYLAKGAVNHVLKNYENITFKKSEEKFLSTGRGADIFIQNKKVGCFGEVSSQILKKFDIRKSTAVFDINIDALLDLKQNTFTYKPFIRLPSVKRDLAFVFPQNVETESILRLIEGFEADIIRNFEIIDIYVGKELYGKKSIAIRIEYQHEKRTLRDREVAELESKIVNVITRRLGGKLRDVKEGQ